MQHLLWVLAALCCSVLQEEPHTIDTIAISAVVTDYAANNSAPNRQLGTTITAAFLACDAWAHFYCHYRLPNCHSLSNCPQSKS